MSNPNHTTNSTPNACTYLTPGTPEWAAGFKQHRPRDAAAVRIIKAEPAAVEHVVAGYGLTPVSSFAPLIRTVTELIELSPLIDPTDTARLLDPANIELYATKAADIHTANVVERREGFLRRISRNLGIMEPAARTYSTPRKSPPPLPGVELDGYLRLFDAQSLPENRGIGRTAIALGAGCAATPADLWHARRSHITDHGDGRIDITLHGRTQPRTVPVDSAWVPTLQAGIAELPATEPRDRLFTGSRPKDFLAPLLSRIDWADKDRLSMPRLRITWICNRLFDGCRLDQIRVMLGDKGYSAITAAAAHLPDPTDDNQLFEQFRCGVQ